MAEEDLGSMMPLGGQASPQPSVGGMMPREANSGSTWQDWIAKNRPFLTGMGQQLLVGSPGGLLQQFGPAIAKGNESEVLTEQMNHERAVGARDFQAKQSEGEANRQSHEKIARESNDTKHQIAQEKIAGMLERSRLIRQPQTNQEMKIVADATNKYMTAAENQAILSKLTPEQRNEAARAYGLSVLETARSATGVRSQGAPLPAETPGSSPTQTSGTPGASPPATSAATSDKSVSKPWDQYIEVPGVKEALKDPAFRERLVKEHPEYRARVQMWQKEQDAQEFRKKNYPTLFGTPPP